MNQQSQPANASGGKQPFWSPWGPGGYLWRTCVFLLGCVLICLLLSLLVNGNRSSGSKPGSDQDAMDTMPKPQQPVNPLQPNQPFIPDSTLVDDWNDSIPNVPELPSPEDNFIPPVDSTRVIVNPEDTLSQIVSNQLNVFFNSKDVKKDMAEFAKQFKQVYPDPGYEITYYNPAAGTMLLTVPEDQLLKVEKELPGKIPNIDFIVVTNEILQESAAASKPSDSGFGQAKYDEYFRLIQAYDAWEVTRGSKNVKVAIVDSYFDLNNPEIGERYVDPIHIPSRTNNVLPPRRMPTSGGELTSFCHGSHVAGIAIGAQNNKIGCSGIAPECTWIPISLGDQLTSFNIIEGLLYAVYHDADVVNFSLGRNFPEEAAQMPIGDQVSVAKQTDRRGEKLWQHIIKIANDHNCVLCTSAGNNTLLMGMDPKNRNGEIIKVEAVDAKGIMAEFSNFGKVPEAQLSYSTVAAPGVAIWSVTPKTCAPIWKMNMTPCSLDEGMVEMDGTSMASPMVAGAVALLKSKKKDLTTQEVIKILTTTAKQTDTKNRIGPTIQLRAALDAVGGELLNFDDLMKNHDLLVGKWKSTKRLALEDTSSKQKLDELWEYFIFTSTSKGVKESHAINTKRIYKADLSVTWGSNGINITQLANAVSADGNQFNKDDFVCRPNSNRLLEVSVQRNGKERYKFMLEKVN